MHHAPQLFDAFNFLIVDTENYVVFFKSGFACGRILVNHRDLDPVFILYVQIANAIGGDITSIDSQIGSATRLFAIENIRMAFRLRSKLWQACQRRRQTARLSPKAAILFSCSPPYCARRM